MFKCEKCKKNTAPGEKLHKYPIKFRDKIYQKEIGNGIRKKLVTSYGKEIVKEINICENCYAEVKKDVCV